DGPGYPGKDKLSQAEMQLEQRLRKEDEARFMKELEKHRNWPRMDTKAFRKRIDEAQEILSRKNIALWTWAERVGRMHVQNKNYERAAKTYEDHIAAAAKDSPDLPRAYAALSEVYLTQQDLVKTRALHARFMKEFNANGGALYAFGKTVLGYHDRVTGKDRRREVLDMAEASLRRASELPDNGSKLLTLLELGNTLVLQERAEQAVPFFETVVKGTDEVAAREDRELRLGDALRRSGRLEEAALIFKKLVASNRSSVRGAANVGLEYISAQEKEKARKRQEAKE
ncbi:MAG TPA: hypothetical protein VEJ63_18555, partial [Planctomycetota bacterium]|nr:hypothetical protein [Planctomycetota bacterium]